MSSLRRASAKDTAAAVCAVPAVRRAFQGALREMAIRLARLDRAIPPQRVPPLVWLPAEDEQEPGRRITRRTLRKLWFALAFLLAAAAAAGYWTAHVGRLR